MGKNKGGRPPFEPTDEHRLTVEAELGEARRAHAVVTSTSLAGTLAVVSVALSMLGFRSWGSQSPWAMSEAAADTDILAAEAEMQALAVEIETLRTLWPVGDTAIRRAEIGGCLNTACERLAELYGTVAAARPKTLAGAAAQLRRALVVAEDGNGMVHRLIASALAVVEARAKLEI